MRYPGQYFDKETGLFYNYFRTYQPGTGRYTQGDPIGLGGGWNRYSYVEGNPLSYTDPQGLTAATAAGAGIGTIILPGPGTVVGAVVGTAIGVGVAWWMYSDPTDSSPMASRSSDKDRATDVPSWARGKSRNPMRVVMLLHSDFLMSNTDVMILGPRREARDRSTARSRKIVSVAGNE